MSNIASVVRKDLSTVSSVTRVVLKGMIRGLYTPLLLNTGIEQFTKGSKSFEETLGEGIMQGTGFFFGHLPLAFYAFDKGYGPEYLGLIATTNTIDYLVHAYKRSKNSSFSFYYLSELVP